MKTQTGLRRVSHIERSKMSQVSRMRRMEGSSSLTCELAAGTDGSGRGDLVAE